MRKIIWRIPDVGDTVAEMRDDGTWACDNELMNALLNTLSKTVIAECPASAGDPVANAFAAAIERWGPDEIVNDTTAGKVPAGTKP